MSIFIADQAQYAQSPEFPWSPTPFPAFDDGITLGSPTPVPSETSRVSDSVRQHSRFRFTKRFCLLTYSQVPGDFSHSAIATIIHGDGGSCCIGRELHQDGGTHYHAFVDYARVRDLSNERRWDVQGVHPNVRPVSRTPWAAYEYARKHGDIVHDCFTDANRPRRPSDRGQGSSRKRWTDITDAPTKDEFFKKIKADDPRSLVVSFRNVQSYAEWQYPSVRRQYEQPVGLTISASIPAELRGFAERVGKHGAGRPRSLIIYGDTRLGKTLFARSLGNHMFFGGLFNLDNLDESADYCVLDDIQGGLEFFHGYKFWLGAQYDFTCTDKYRHKRDVHWGKPTIWTSNRDPRLDRGADIGWLEGNCDIVCIDSAIAWITE
uniref:Replication-associated protein n=1 Tax=Genomoviridae sp. TaxID=2202565 RepID=A0A858NGA0_9VIRU|nr:MAG: replication-associated protein [Genomoviridae sp.]